MVTTIDLAEFGFREIKEVWRLLDAWVRKGLPVEFVNERVQVMMNKSGGGVFLRNEDFQVCMMGDDRLEMWVQCSECGREDVRGSFEIYGQHEGCEFCIGGP